MLGILELEYFCRLLLAGACGAFIGYERKRNMKEAGVRTHFIVSMAAALVMLVSKYGFMDVASLPGHSVDVSRVAASVVSGVGFLCAGIIFVRKYTINGLTTAAGIWATSAVGMAIGGGMYVLGVLATLLILFVQVFLHRRWHFLHIPTTERFRVVIENTEDAVGTLRVTMEKNKIDVLGVKMEVGDSGYITLDFIAKFPTGYDPLSLAELLKSGGNIKSVDL